MIAIELDSTFLILRLRIATLPMIGNKVDVQAIRGLISAILVENCDERCVVDFETRRIIIIDEYELCGNRRI